MIGSEDRYSTIKEFKRNCIFFENGVKTTLLVKTVEILGYIFACIYIRYLRIYSRNVGGSKTVNNDKNFY